MQKLVGCLSGEHKFANKLGLAESYGRDKKKGSDCKIFERIFNFLLLVDFLFDILNATKMFLFVKRKERDIIEKSQ